MKRTMIITSVVFMDSIRNKWVCIQPQESVVETIYLCLIREPLELSLN